MNFIDRIDEYNILNNIKTSDRLTCVFLTGDYGIGKSALIVNFFSDKSYMIFNEINKSYFYTILLSIVKSGFHEYLLSRDRCNYKDVFLSSFSNQMPQNEHIVDFILQHNFFEELEEISIEKLISDFICYSLQSTIIFDSFQECSKQEFGRILKLIQCLSAETNRKNITIVFVCSKNDGFIYEHLISMSDVIIPLSGLNKEYIGILLKEYFDNQYMECDKLSDYLYKKYKGNPGKIINMLKLKFSPVDIQKPSQTTILNKIINPEFYALDPTQKRIMLFLTVMPFSISTDRMIDFLISDPDFGNIDDAYNCESKINILADNDLIINNNGILSVNDVMKDLYRQYSEHELSLVYLIYRYQLKNGNNFKDRENADCLHFIIQSQTIECSEQMIQDYYNYTIKTAHSLLANELWEGSVKYFERLLPYKSRFTEQHLTEFMKASYYSADYLLIFEFISSINDTTFKTFEYWYWKGTLLYMLNNICAIECLEKAVEFSENKKNRIYAQITLKQAISESPEHCANTLSFYKNLLKEYEYEDFLELAVLYRNSLVLGGNDTIQYCKKGISIAQKYNQKEEEIKLNHNMQFELFRMSLYDGCELAFNESAMFFQKQAKRVYESAYGYNNLALLNLVNNNIDKAALYILSAVIYAGTPYSIITTHVNSNLINSIYAPDKYDIEYGVNKIKELIRQYNINDERIFRKSYFSIAISYMYFKNNQKAIEYIRKSEPYLGNGRHINRYVNLCNQLNIEPKAYPSEIIKEEDKYYNFYANPNYELWLLAYGHI